MSERNIDKVDRRPGAELLDAAADLATYWLEGGRKAENSGEAFLCAENSANVWKNAAYAMAERLTELRGRFEKACGEITRLSDSSSSSPEAGLRLTAMADRLRKAAERGDVREEVAALLVLRDVARALPSATTPIEIGELVEIPDGFDAQPNTIFCEWNDLRYKLPAGTKVYAMRPADPPTADITPYVGVKS